MKFTEKQTLALVKECSNMKQAEELIFQLVKEGCITPAIMSELIIYAYKQFVY